MRQTERVEGTEIELRAALEWALSLDKVWLKATLTKFEELRFLPDDPALHCASLRARERGSNGAIAVHFSPGGRLLKVVAWFGPDFSAGGTYRLSREYWPKSQTFARSSLPAGIMQDSEYDA